MQGLNLGCPKGNSSIRQLADHEAIGANELNVVYTNADLFDGGLLHH